MGLLNCDLVISDEPGSWRVQDGELLHDAIESAMGKPGSNLRALYFGTVAPSFEGHWWHDLVHSVSGGSRHVTLIEGTGAWDSPHTIRRANPLMWSYAKSRGVLLAERDAARRDERLRARFMSYRLNVPASDASDVVLTVDDWRAVCGRPVPDRQGPPVVAVDMGRERSWSSVASLWPSGRLEVTAVCPGIPGLSEQEKRDGVPAGTYRRLADQGSMVVAEGWRRVPADLVGEAVRSYRPGAVFSDKDRVGELADAGLANVISQVMGWGFWTSAIRQLRLLASNGPLSVAHGSRALLQASLREAKVENSSAGGHRLVKRRRNNKSRDDVVAAILVAAAQWPRLAQLGRPSWRYAGRAG